MTCDVLNLEWSSTGRDREVATLICSALREKGYTVIEASIFNYKHYLLKYRPKLVYAADPKGASINYDAVKFAKKLGFSVVTFTAEGDYIPEEVEWTFWGNISERHLLEELNLHWSCKFKKMILEKVDPALASQIKVSGAVGFDRYKIYQFRKKEEWLEKYNLNYSRIVGYASWTFDGLYNKNALVLLEKFQEKEQVEYFFRDRVIINKILKQLIEQNPDTLFLLKEHPGVVDFNKSELVDLTNYPNVLHIKNEEPVADCINGCDIWMAFDSTTCLESWLLGKPTLLINPFKSDFARSFVYQGSPIFKTVDEVQKVLDNYYERGKIPEFEAKRNLREQLLEDEMQWADGKNHMRAAYLFEQVLLQLNQASLNISTWNKIEAFIQNFLFEKGEILPPIPGLRRYIKARRIFKQSDLEKLTQRYKPYLDAFHAQFPLTDQEILELEQINSLNDAN